MKYKAKDIAREVGVSATAVSLVLNNKPGVGEKKRKEIIDKIIEMNCEYLLKNTNDERAERGNIGFVIYKCVGEIIDEFSMYNCMAEVITRELGKYGYKMVIIYLDNNSPEEFRETLERFQCEGYIVYGVEMYAKDARLFQDLNMPCVFLDNPFRDAGVDAVTVDNYRGMRLAFEHLYEMGHREIGYIKSKVRIQCFEERYDAFCKYMHEKGLEVKSEYIMPVSYKEMETDADVKLYLQKNKKLPTAFMSDNDLLGCRALRVFRMEGIRVPEEVSFIGFDNRPICSFVEPDMTTIQLPSQDMGDTAVSLLMRRMEKRNAAALKCWVNPEIVLRHSVGRIG